MGCGVAGKSFGTPTGFAAHCTDSSLSRCRGWHRVTYNGHPLDHYRRLLCNQMFFNRGAEAENVQVRLPSVSFPPPLSQHAHARICRRKSKGAQECWHTLVCRVVLCLPWKQMKCGLRARSSPVTEASSLELVTLPSIYEHI